MANETNTGVVEAQPVVANTDGSSETPTERTFKESEIQKFLDDRFKKHSSVVADLQKKLAEAEEKSSKKVSSNVEEDLRNKLTKYETEIKSRDEKLGEYRQKQLSAELYQKLNTHGCVEPELAVDHFLNRKLVHLDQDGNMVVENVRGNLDDLITDFLDKRPSMRSATVKSGVGSKPNKVASNAPATSQDQRLLEAANAIGVDLERMKNSNKRR
jgi:hypothetical protein